MKRILLLLMAINVAITAVEFEKITDKINLPILSPSLSSRKTEKIRLANGLEAYLISDPQADLSGAAITVNAGSWQDPDEYPGIAHFLEHMLFLGTKKYPQESGYQRFITEHGGNTNAFTRDNATSYIFSVENDFFEQALDRFADTFVEPLLSISGVARELNAIDQEYAKNLDSDDIRSYYVLRYLADPKHPFHKFNMGNSSTLKGVTQDRLRDWYLKHYSSNIMKLAIYSKLPLDDLRNLVISKFSSIPNKNYKPLVVENPTSPQYNGHIIYIESIKDLRLLNISWNLPTSFAKMKETRPDRLLCHVLGHEGKNSLLSELKNEGLANALQCGSMPIGSDLLEFQLQIDLTDEGYQKIDQVIATCFKAIQNFSQGQFPPYIFDEVHNMGVLKYEYQSREDVFNTLMKYAMWFTDEDMSTFPLQSTIIQKFDSQAIHELLKYLTPENAKVLIMAPADKLEVKPDKMEPWLKVNYSVSPVTNERKSKWKEAGSENAHIALPEPNPYIPEKLQSVAPYQANETTQIPHPSLLVKDDFMTLYFATDTRYGMPEVLWNFRFRTPEIQPGDAQQIVLADLYKKTLEEAIKPFSYLASMAELDQYIEIKDDGLNIEISGFSDHALLFWEEIVKRLKTLDPTQEQFKQYRESLMREYENFSKESSLQQGIELLKKSIHQNFTTEKEKLSAIKKINFKKFQEFLANVFEKVYVEGMLYGNQTESIAREVQVKLKTILRPEIYSKEERYVPKVIALPPDSGPYYIEKTNKVQGNATILAIEVLPYSFKKHAAQQTLMQGLENPFFAELRTKQQTGYIVFSQMQELERTLLSFFAVQSNTHNPRDLLFRFELFLETSLQNLGKEFFKEEDFNIIKKALISQLSQPPKNIKDMGKLLNRLAFYYDGDFDWVAKRINGFKELTYKEFLEITYSIIGKENKKRVGILLKGQIDEKNIYEYSRLPNNNALMKLSQFVGR